MTAQGGLLVGAVALLGALVLAAPPAAKDQEASFKIEIRADQTSTWTLDYTTEGCGDGTSHLTGHGTQDLSTVTLKPCQVKGVGKQFGGPAFWLFEYARGAAGVPVNVAAMREGV